MPMPAITPNVRSMMFCEKMFAQNPTAVVDEVRKFAIVITCTARVAARIPGAVPSAADDGVLEPDLAGRIEPVSLEDHQPEGGDEAGGPPHRRA